MDENVENEGKKEKKGRRRKIKILVDFTPMVDMNMLLITFFMLCSTLNKPQTMEISMPSRDKVAVEEQTKVKESAAITLILGKDDQLYYYSGLPDYGNPASLIAVSYAPDGLRNVLLNRNEQVVRKMNDLKQRRLTNMISQEDYEKQADEIREDKRAPVVMIKATDDSSYKNLIDVLDEMHICQIGRYAIVDLSDEDRMLLSAHTAQVR